MRELKNVIEKAVLLSDGPHLEAEHLEIAASNGDSRTAGMGNGFRLPVIATALLLPTYKPPPIAKWAVLPVLLKI